jgi:hypothetical protein
MIIVSMSKCHSPIPDWQDLGGFGGRNTSLKHDAGFPTEDVCLNIDSDNSIKVRNAIARFLAGRTWAGSEGEIRIREAMLAFQLEKCV